MVSRALFEKAYRESRAADAPVFVDDALVLKADGDYFHVLTQRLYAAFEWGLAAHQRLPKECISYLQCVIDQSMSPNNARALAEELLGELRRAGYTSYSEDFQAVRREE